MRGALDGVRVVDLSTGPLGGMATMILGDHGAEVLKVEPPGGDRFRCLPSAPLWLRGKRVSSLTFTKHQHGRCCTILSRVRMCWSSRDLQLRQFAGVCRSRTSLRLGPTSCIVRSRVGVAAADLLTCRRMKASWPLGPGECCNSNASSAKVARCTRRCRSQYIVAAQGALQGVLAALIARQRGAVGAQRVETSVLQGLLPFDLAELLLLEVASRGGGALPSPYGVGGSLPTLNYHPIPTEDGRWIQCGNLLEHLFIVVPRRNGPARGRARRRPACRASGAVVGGSGGDRSRQDPLPRPHEDG